MQDMMEGTRGEARRVSIECLQYATEGDAEQLLILPFFAASDSTGMPSWVPKSLQSMVLHFFALGDFAGRVGEIAVLYPHQDEQPQRLVLLGLGDSTRWAHDCSREAAAEVGRYCVDRSHVSILIDGLLADSAMSEGFVQAFTEGFLLGIWERDMDTRTGTGQEELRIAFFIGDGCAAKGLQEACDRGMVIAEAIQLARDVSNAPASDLTPSAFVSLASGVAESSNIRCSALTQDEMADARLSGLQAVSRGSAEPPAFIILEHAPAGVTGKPVVLIGKGITFDSGGLNLKPGSKLPRMKHDKSGVGVVLAVMSALAKLEIPLHVVGLLPVAENMPSGTAAKPGDVISMANGQTVEIISTDAEGRLILADALLYARRFSPSFIIDVASLSGATRVALGDEASGLFSNSRHLQKDVIEAGYATGEPVWPFPLLRSYLKELRTPFADLRNAPLSTEKGGGGCIAAAFLSEFVSCSWAHIDTAGTAWDNHSRRYYPREGASGFGVRLLIEFLRYGNPGEEYGVNGIAP
jgi:leucyl aminopeptidase